MRRYLLLFAFALLMGTTASVTSTAQTPDSLANATVLIVRHAEKPPEKSGDSGLTPAGLERAQKYAAYFHPFHWNGESIDLNALYAGTDTKGSIRPRLTLEPLSRATGIVLNTQYSTEEPEALAHALRTTAHGNHILIAWRHKKIAALLEALGANSQNLLAGGVWPDDVYDWVIVLRYNAEGKLARSERIVEPNPLP